MCLVRESAPVSTCQHHYSRCCVAPVSHDTVTSTGPMFWERENKVFSLLRRFVGTSCFLLYILGSLSLFTDNSNCQSTDWCYTNTKSWLQSMVSSLIFASWHLIGSLARLPKLPNVKYWSPEGPWWRSSSYLQKCTRWVICRYNDPAINYFFSYRSYS